MSPNDPPLRDVRTALERGQHELAERLARRAVEQAPSEAAWALLAEARSARGDLVHAVAAARQSLRLAPGGADAHHRLAVLVREAGERGEAEALLRQALALRPEHVESLLQLGVMLGEGGRPDEALPLLERAVLLRPGSAQARHNLGVALAQAGRAEEAVQQLGEALRLEPGYAEAGYNLGAVLAQLGRRNEAEAAFRAALTARPDHHGLLNNLGLLLHETNRPGEAAVLLRQAARLRPGAAEAHNNLGLALADLGRFDQAEASYHEALQLDPLYADAHANLAGPLKEMGRHEEALACYDMALRLDPRSRSARYNRSLCLLQMGRWEEGFREYEHRHHRKGVGPRELPGPRWQGEPLDGKTVLLVTEQGLGDAIQFARYASVLKRRGARVLLECPGYLVPLLSRCGGIDGLAAEGEPLPPYDYHCPLMSVPGVVGTTVEDVPCEVPYLHVEEEAVRRWRGWVGPAGPLRVGVAWQGNPYYANDRWRSAPLRLFKPLSEVGGVELVSLQREHGLDQLRGVSWLRVPEEGMYREGPFVDAVALMRCLDLVVCVDTALGHLAGALGVPAWLMLAAVSDWRWLLGRDDTPWYPSTRLFRQRALGDWHEVFDRVAAALRGRVTPTASVLPTDRLTES